MKRSLVLGVVLVLLGGLVGEGRAQRVGLQELPLLLPGPPRVPVPKPIDNLILLESETIDVRLIVAAENAARINDGLARLGLTPAQPTYYLVHTRLPADEALLAAYTRAGGEVVSFIPRNTYIVRGNEATMRAIAALPEVDLVTLYHPIHRLSPRLVARLPQFPGPVRVHVLLFPSENPLAAQAAFAQLGGIVEDTGDTPYGPLLRMRFPPAAVPFLANLSGVQWVEEYVEPRLYNDLATGFTDKAGIPSGGIMNIEPVWNQGLDGSGMIVGHADSGLDVGVNNTSIHDDFEDGAGGTRITAAFGWARKTTLATHTFVSGWLDLVNDVTWEAHRFVPTSDGEVLGVVLAFTNWSGFGATRGTISCYIYSDSNGAPDSVITNGTGSLISASKFDENLRAYWVSFQGPSVSHNTPYWIVLNFSNAVGTMYTFSSEDGTNQHRTSSNGTTWNDPDARHWYYQVFATGAWSDLTGHGTHTAGSILGNGAQSSGQFRGPAYQANLVHQSLDEDGDPSLEGIPSDLDGLFGQAYLLGARIHSDSWGSKVNGDYDLAAMQADAFVWDHPDMLIVTAAGNEGTDANSDGVVDQDSMTSPGTAKNVLTVGASENLRSGEGYNVTYGAAWPSDFPADPIKSDHVSNRIDGMAAFSSRGPCDDNRIKPDVVAPGTNIISCRSQQPGAGTGWGVYNTYYVYRGGTSMACPLTAGAATLVREFFVEQKNHNPSAALIKATLIHGATDIPGQYIPSEAGTVPNYNEGWGRVNLYDSLYPAVPTYFMDATQDNGLALTNTQTSVQATVYVTGSTNPLKATLVWTDPPSNPAGTGGLINDLDLRIYRRNADNTADEATHYPKGVEGGAAGDDATNNVEQVEVASPIVNRYYRIEVSVSGSLNANYSTQPFALIVSGNFSEPTAVAVAECRAVRRGRSVYLSWSVAEGSDVAGFNLYRGRNAGGPFRRVNRRFLAFEEEQDSYWFEDWLAPSGEVYYQLEVVTTNGQRQRYGPVRLAPLNGAKASHMRRTCHG